MDFIRAAAKLGLRFVPVDFAVRTDHLLCQIQLLRSGAGIGGTHVGLASHWPELVRIMRWAPLPPLPFWCVTHRDVQYNSRIRAVTQFLIRWFADDPYGKALV